MLDASPDVAVARLANLTRSRSLLTASPDACGEGITGRLRFGPPGPAPGMSSLAEVGLGELAQHGDCACHGPDSASRTFPGNASPAPAARTPGPTRQGKP